MKIKLKKIYECGTALNSIGQLDFEVKTAYWIGRNADILFREIQQIEKQRIALVKKYGIEDEKKRVKVPEEKVEDFKKELDSLLDTEIKVDIKPISISSLGDRTMKPADLVALDFMFVMAGVITKPEKKDEAK